MDERMGCVDSLLAIGASYFCQNLLRSESAHLLLGDRKVLQVRVSSRRDLRIVDVGKSLCQAWFIEAKIA